MKEIIKSHLNCQLIFHMLETRDINISINLFQLHQSKFGEKKSTNKSEVLKCFVEVTNGLQLSSFLQQRQSIGHSARNSSAGVFLSLSQGVISRSKGIRRRGFVCNFTIIWEKKKRREREREEQQAPAG